MAQLLADRRMSLDYRPEPGEEVTLRAVANISQGGTVEDMTDRIHPDNRTMAEALARAFRMDTMGVDFITENIGRSWRESACAIIEVNQTSEFRQLSKAELIMSRLFPASDSGRVPAILVVEEQPHRSHEVFSILENTGLLVGCAYPSQTLLGEELRGGPEDDLKTRIDALLADPLCESLLVSTSEDYITRYGPPLDRFDLAVITEGQSSSAEHIVAACCEQVFRDKDGENMVTSLEASVLELATQFQTRLKQ